MMLINDLQSDLAEVQREIDAVLGRINGATSTDNVDVDDLSGLVKNLAYWQGKRAGINESIDQVLRYT